MNVPPDFSTCWVALATFRFSGAMKAPSVSSP